MQYPVDNPQQLRTILRSLRQARGLTQTQLGERLGVTQKRIARIEAAPEVTAFDQISRMVTAMGYSLVIDEPSAHRVAEPGPDTW
ncbi:MAG: helix-turn-helix transcriptional regulator [Polaromonas sp.]|uniref:helix-turn-helix domain-containing protein n=1 Tax=Polaromonas sp. TaxID=1869339 RepID=UPI00272FE894|nr:helix-turn-helix transcriptional regulator [Polaromonas sp.]MDP1743102.1 helix-turn-helix transcriptional regulator [Polaromonas sp.]MDP1954122.1 helix-turn-helix transcriptional regulator [Polaromonas sp.]MDP3753654.1 helix-turn-helix transcriptional regulator [Polaromonas sp.]